jgi:preprotein translocase subunit YajC
MLFASALAADTTAAAAPAADATSGFGGGMGQLLLFVPIILVFYFLLIRPQQKKAKEHKALVTNIRRGDRVVTQGGIIGQVTKVVSDSEVQVEISDGVRVRVMRGSISDVLTKSSPAESTASEPVETAEKKGKVR